MNKRWETSGFQSLLKSFFIIFLGAIYIVREKVTDNSTNILYYNLILTMNDRIFKKSIAEPRNGRIVDQSVDTKQTIPLYL